MDKRQRVLKKIGAQRRKEKRKQALLDAGSDRKQQNYVFHLQHIVKVVITMTYFMEKTRQVLLNQLPGKQEIMKR
jgi:hypothetical protein